MAKRKRRNFTAEFKAEVVLEALSGKVPDQNYVGGPITSAKHVDTLRISLLLRGLVPFIQFSRL